MRLLLDCIFPTTSSFSVGVFVPIPSLPLVLSQKRLLFEVSPPLAVPNVSCQLVNPESCAPVTEDIPIEFPIRVRPFEKVKRSENSPVPELYDIPPVAEREVSPIFVARDVRSVEKFDETVPERVFTRPESVEISALVFVRLPERFAVTFCSTVLILHERELMFPERVFTVPLMAFCARESVK